MMIVGLPGVMFWLNWDFTLVAVAVMLFAARFKKATHEVRHRQSDIVAVLQQGFESMRVVKAFGRQEARLGDVRRATVEAALKVRRVKSLLAPVVTVVVSLCTALA
jgi:ABC-type multidrug transport system fused ATPase/permease subunit